MSPAPPAFLGKEAAASALSAAADLFPPGDAQAALLAALARAADPDRALVGTIEVARARARRTGTGRPWTRTDWLEVVATLTGASRAYGRILRTRPRLAERLATSPFLDRPKPEAQMREALAKRTRALDPLADDALERLMRILRRYRRREMARIALRDLTGRGRLEEIMGELSALAAASLDAALPILDARMDDAFGPLRPGEHTSASATSPGFAVIAMGKLGGGELNLSSDIDVLYVYDSDTDLPGGHTAFERHARLAELLGRVIGEPTEDGFVFRVDTALRPEGRSGPLVNSIAALEAYYESFGRTWERQALLKARPVAGDLAVGEAALSAIEPFVYRRSLDLDTVRRVVAMKDELDQSVRRRGIAENDLKLGRGGIRAIELLVQSLQLLHAGKSKELRDRSTLGALDRLLFAGRLDEADVRALADAYVFLRRAEHRLQMVDDRQTQRLPPPGSERRALARALGLPGERELETALDAHRRRVESVLDARFGVAEPEKGVPDTVRAALDIDAPDEAREAALSAAGFRDEAAALAHLRRLGRRPTSPFGRAASTDARHLSQRLVAEVARSPDPDAALAYLAELFAALPPPAAPGYYRLLVENPAARQLLVSLFGTSDFLSRDFVRHPELLDVLILRSHAVLVRPLDALATEIEARLARIPGEDEEARLSALRRYRHEEVLRIGLADVSGALSVAEVSEQLTDLAQALLEACVVLAAEWGRARWGWPVDEAGEEIPLAVLGLGGLGGREMGYGSDLDLLFLYGTDGTSTGGSRGQVGAQEMFSRLAQRLISYLTLPLTEGALYQIDTRLRPSGRQGMLVTTLSGFRAYHAQSAQVWERQALTKARAVAGPEPFRRAVETAACEAAYVRTDPETLAAAVREMRARMETELGREGEGAMRPKVGRGGLADIQFVVQFLQLRDGPEDPALREPGTPGALRALIARGRLDPEAGVRLEAAYWFLRRLEHRLRIVHDRPTGALPRGARALDALARRMGYHPGPDGAADPAGALLTDYRRTTEEVRAIYRTVLGE